MGDSNDDPLKISPKYTALDWAALNPSKDTDWHMAADILRDRLNGRFLRYATDALPSPFSGFVVLAIDSLLLEALQQFREGLLKADSHREKKAKNGNGRTSQDLITAFLSGSRFQPYFDKPACDRYYWDIRCGLLHQAEAKEMWRIRRKQEKLLQPAKVGHGYIIDVQKFHEAVSGSLDDYLAELVLKESEALRQNLWTKMGHICSVRRKRGEAYPVGDDT